MFRRELFLSSLTFFILLGLVVSVNADSLMWSQTYGGSQGDYANSVVATSDGGYAIAGYIGINNGDFWLIKTDEFGYMEWNKTYGGTLWDHAESLIVTSDGGYVITGSLGPFASERFDLWLVKTDVYGKMEWNRTYEGALGNSLVATSDGGYALAGEKSDDFWLIKTDEYGVVPEYSSWLLPSILLTATLFIVLYKKKLLKK